MSTPTTGAAGSPPPRPADPYAPTGEPQGEPTIGELIGEISQDMSRLVRDEIELAKAELKQESAKAGKAAGMLGGAGYAAHLAVLLLSLTLLFALDHAMDIVWATLIVAVLWAVAAAVLYTQGRKRIRTVNLKPEQTVETLKEDARWARNPTS
ncbi:phage holin family protein [Streptomyces sp. NPDC060194]|uniref:phage holin family protein n=1 Tax=Streptomyces sp. NPDC060194 TaxID=3347069 RepID=UPI00365B5DDD